MTNLDPIWDAVVEIADPGSVRGQLDYTKGLGTGLLSFTIDEVPYIVDIYQPEES